jgi:succinyl-CoA synthetase beta subunit
VTKLPQSAEQIIQKALEEKRNSLLEPEAKEICHAYGLPTPEFGVSTSAREAAELAEKLGFPVVLKIVSQDILHKTEAGGVLLDIKTKGEVEEGFDQVRSSAKTYNPNVRIAGVLVQHMAEKGIEVIVGGIRDSQFGSTVLFGLGGIFVEVLKDAAFRVAPITELDARDMIHEIRSYPALEGIRGQPPADKEAINTILQGTSRIMTENSRISQIDLNPVMVYAHGASIVDARMILSDRA